MTDIPSSATAYGFTTSGLGAHSSRTMMLSELRLLLAACPAQAGYADYQRAALDENVLLKQTVVTRQKSFRYLRELYGLAPSLLLFRALRELWDAEAGERPLLALLCAVGRDPSLRATCGVILNSRPGEAITSDQLARAAGEFYPGLQVSTLAKIGRNTASSWAQSGHLAGRTDKQRTAVQAGPISTTYALLLGYLCGGRGAALFETLWARLLDAPRHALHEYAQQAAQQGWLEYRHAGEVTEITFRHFLPDG